MSPSSLVVPPGERAPAEVEIRVPPDASPGERYGVVLAEAPPVDTTSGSVAPRVGIRIYLSVGEGNEPASNFVVDSLRAGREETGESVVLARVENTGGRALDMRGELSLEDGPGGLSAGPFPAQLGTTIGIGESSEVRVALDPEIPNGPWVARLTLQSGELAREVEAEITFPEEPGTFGDPVDADPVEQQRRILIPVATGAAAVVVAALGWSMFGQRRAAKLARSSLRRLIRR